MNVLFPAVIDDLRAAVEPAAQRLLSYSDAEAARRPGPGKWSRKEIIGHLIDSACNNHGRFVRAQLQDDLVFPGYDQDAWVRVQRYQERPWKDLIAVWQTYNHHIAHVMATTDAAQLTRARARHNLDDLAWKAVSAMRPTTLEYFMRDYVDHLKHHVKQTEGG